MESHRSSNGNSIHAQGPLSKLARALGLLFAYAIAWLILSLVLLATAKFVLGVATESMDAATEMAYEGFFMILAVAILNVLYHFAFKSKEALSGWPNLHGSLRGFGNGALIGLGMSGGMFVLTMLMGGGQFSSDGAPWTAYILRIVPLLFFILISTMGEEWLFRGYPLAMLAKYSSRGWGNLMMAILFAIMHATAEGFNGLVAFNIVIGSLVVGALRFTPGGIPAAWGFHFAWNSLQVLLGSNLTGLDLKIPCLRFSGRGADWLSGGATGPEGSIGATLATILVLGLLTAYFRRKNNTDLPIPTGSKRSEVPIPKES